MKSFHKIIIRIRQRHIDFTTMRNSTGTMHQNKVCILTQFSTVSGTAQRMKNLLGAFQIFFALSTFHITSIKAEAVQAAAEASR